MNVRKTLAPRKSTENDEKLKKIQKNFRKKNFGEKKSKFANRLKRALPKFRGDRSGGRGVNGRSKFVAASAGRAERKQFTCNMEINNTKFSTLVFCTTCVQTIA